MTTCLSVHGVPHPREGLRRAGDSYWRNILTLKASRAVVLWPLIAHSNFAFTKMSTIIKLILIFLSALAQCNLLNTFPTKETKLVKESVHKSEYNLQSVILKPFKCHSDFLWRRLDNLKQWKKRRRIFVPIKILPYKTDKLRERRKRAVESQSRTIELVQTRSGLSVPVEHSLSLVARFKQQWPVRLWRERGWYTDDYLVLINSHWLRFPPPDPKVNYALGSLYIVMMVVGSSGNALVLLMYLRYVTFQMYVIINLTV